MVSVSKGLNYANKISQYAFSMLYAPLTSRYIFLYFIWLASRQLLIECRGNQVSSGVPRNWAFCTTESEGRQAGGMFARA